MAASAKVQTRVDVQADRSRELNITTTVVLVLSVVFVALRFWARHIRAGYGADDWMTVAALVFVFISGAVNYAMISHGLGRHADVVPTTDQVAFFKLLFGL
ncbi:hypothetical protein CEP52_007165 [Fusarium oligoseptatum]|uniref:Rhodopsin domain-containing protein n=1 Tax=Fusarium oligoseptatum TaxID=2604345 RepID=A0A428TNW8_9HYPO|nr:hypothetical protein CEP52_007165 [Fusarium oligoseptatum]